MLTQERLKQLLHYDPLTGIFTRLVRTCNKVRVGAIAGVDSQHGYCRIYVDAIPYMAHRLAWLYMTGSFPVDQVDHINHDGHDNKWENLREATNKTNSHNRNPLKWFNATGFFGVTRYGKSGKFKAAIMIDGKCKHLGVYSDPAEAHLAYLKAKRCLHEGNTL